MMKSKFRGVMFVNALLWTGSCFAECSTGVADVDASKDWQQIIPNVSPLARVEIRTEGVWTYDNTNDFSKTDSDGVHNLPPATDRNKLIYPNANLGALIGKIGNEVRKLGETVSFVPWGTGPLYGMMNDLKGSYGDNEGVIKVNYSICPIGQ